MVALAALIWLPRWAIAGVAFIMLGGHNLIDGVRAEERNKRVQRTLVYRMTGNDPATQILAKLRR